MVFGVAAFSLVVQRLTMPWLLDRLWITSRTDVKEFYEILSGRARAVDAALDAAERLFKDGDLPRDVYEGFTAEYERERADLDDAVSRLLRENSELRREELLVGERRVLQVEKSAVMDAIRRGIVSGDVGDRLLEEIDVKLDLVDDGQSTVEQREEGYEEFWRSRAAEFDFEFEPDSDAEAVDDRTFSRLSGSLSSPSPRRLDGSERGRSRATEGSGRSHRVAGSPGVSISRLCSLRCRQALRRWLPNAVPWVRIRAHERGVFGESGTTRGEEIAIENDHD